MSLRSIAVCFGSGSSSIYERARSRSQEYHYLVLEGDEPKIGDVVVTSTSAFGRDAGYPVELKAARVTEIHGVCSSKATKFYLQLLSKEQIVERKKANEARKEREAERGRIRAQLELRLKEQSAQERFAALAEKDPEAAELLKKLEAL